MFDLLSAGVALALRYNRGLFSATYIPWHRCMAGRPWIKSVTAWDSLLFPKWLTESSPPGSRSVQWLRLGFVAATHERKKENSLGKWKQSDGANTYMQTITSLLLNRAMILAKSFMLRLWASCSCIDVAKSWVQTCHGVICHRDWKFFDKNPPTLEGIRMYWHIYLICMTWIKKHVVGVRERVRQH